MPTDITKTFNLHPAPIIPPGDRTYTDVIFSTYTKVNVEYAPNLFMDIYLPVGDTKTDRACVFTLHGGGGTYTGFKQWAKYWGSLGYVAISLQYGETNPYTAERQRRNVTRVGAAVRYIRQAAVTYGIDPAKILGIGVSAGGLTIFSYAVAANDLSDPYFDSVENDLYPLEANGILASSTIPANCTTTFIPGFLDASDPPNHWYHGDLDTKFPIGTVIDRYNTMVAVVPSATLTIFPGAGHSVNNDATIKADLTPKFAALVA